MSKEQINLSDALDLIAQSKADIKTSVDNKGGNIGDDLTQYSTAIDDIVFVYLQSDMFNLLTDVYAEGTEHAVYAYDSNTHQLVNIDPKDIDVYVSETMIQNLNEAQSLIYDPNIVTVTKDYLWPEQQQGTKVILTQAINNGKANVVVHYIKGNTDFVGTVTNHEYQTNIMIDSVLDENENTITVDNNVIQCSPNTTLKVRLKYNNGNYVPDINYDNITFTFYNADSTMTLDAYQVSTETFGEYYILTPNVAEIGSETSIIWQIDWINDSRSMSGQAYFTISNDEPTFTYDGSDENNPIICNISLGEDEDQFDTFGLNISVDGATQDMSDIMYWTPDVYRNGVLSNDNDFKLTGSGSLNSPGLEPRDGDQWFTGTRTAGTYLKSYTMTYTYNNNNGEDHVMQQLDGTSITFWVQYNVTSR